MGSSSSADKNQASFFKWNHIMHGYMATQLGDIPDFLHF